MNNFFEFLNSSVGRKWLMALTGLFLCLFVVVHVSGNLQLFKDDGGKAFNQYSVFMTTFPPIKIISYLNYATILLHAFNGFYLVLRNKKARKVGYSAKKDTRGSSWSSRNMGLLGSILLIFIVIHMGDFWREFHFGDMPAKRYITNTLTGVTEVKDIPHDQFTEPKHYFENGTEVVEVKDLYADVAEAFKNPFYSIFYVVAMIALAYHLVHGFQSAFQTLGIRQKNYAGIIKGLGLFVFGIIIPALFAAMPIHFLIFVK